MREDAMASRPQVQVRRVYDGPDASGGRRVLVDRLWPRGLSKQAAAVDEWLKAVAPSAELRRWYGHEPARFEEFRSRYEAELGDRERGEALAHLRELTRQGPVTLVTATRDVAHSHAAVLAGHLREET
jgi:uncharacterized protein YeaO (DUF488 family)